MIRTTLLISGLLLATVSIAQTPSSAPSGSTGQCNDSSYWSGPTKKGACRGHKGVKAWYGAAATAGVTAAPAPAAASPAATAAASPAAPSQTAAPKPATLSPAAAAAGGGAGKVWVNSSTKVYHCPSDRYYGKTKSGTYMSEADAVAQGDHPDHGKACSK